MVEQSTVLEFSFILKFLNLKIQSTLNAYGSLFEPELLSK